MAYIGKVPSAVPLSGADIPANSIDASKLVDGSITLADIADDAVTADKLHNDVNTVIAANTAKTGITSNQASAITANTAKTGITSSQASAITANTAKTGITSSQASAITANTAKVTNSTSASDLSSGTLPDARFPSTLPAISGANLTDVDAATVSTTAPSSPAAGDMWFDTTTGTTAMKVWSGTGWDQMSNKFSATGGTESTYTSGGVQYKVHTFTSSGTFTAESSGAIDVLVVAGGGGGSGAFSGGGGAAGIVYATTYTVSPSAFSVLIGAGAGGGLGWQNASNMQGGTGGDSSVFGLIAKGGGGASGFYGGASYGTATLNVNYAIPGGCGGGGGSAHPDMPSHLAGVSNQGTFTGATSYGNDGGQGHQVSGTYHGGGGGGAGAVGGAGSQAAAGNGGNGQAFTIRTGSSITYAGGGGAGSQNTDFGTGGTGGGGAGTLTSSPIGVSGGINLGGGGGGGGYSSSDPNNRHGGNGGSGIVVVRYRV